MSRLGNENASYPPTKVPLGGPSLQREPPKGGFVLIARGFSRRAGLADNFGSDSSLHQLRSGGKWAISCSGCHGGLPWLAHLNIGGRPPGLPLQVHMRIKP